MERTAERVREVSLRIQNFCDWFGVPHPRLRRIDNEIYFTMEFVEWLQSHGASIDWIVAGDVRPMAEAYRREKLYQNALDEIDEEAKDIDLDAFEE